MTEYQKALDLSRLGLYVFPVKLTDDSKTPYTARGHLDATRDPGVIEEWFNYKFPNAVVGVAAGVSGLVILDVDCKNGKDGFQDLDDNFYDIPATYDYETVNGGSHYVYSAPDGVVLNGVAKYRRMPGVDRRAGSSWVLWNGAVPGTRLAFKTAPEWLLDPSVVRSADAFDGDLELWYDALTPGQPNVLVRRAIDRIKDDMSHSDMVEAQYNAIRLGAEGNPGVPYLLQRLEEAWLARDAAAHSTPEGEWEFKFADALRSGVERYGAHTSKVSDLPAWNLSLIPAAVDASQFIQEHSYDPALFSRLLGQLVSAGTVGATAASILWNAPATLETSREWGLDFVYKRIDEATVRPEPIRENPSLVSEPSVAPRTTPGSSDILTPDEIAHVLVRPTFIDEYVAASSEKGFCNVEYAVPAAWTLLSMAFGFHAFIPKGVKIGTNLWFNILGYSGTGKSSEDDFLTDCLNLLLKNVNDEVFYNLGAGSSPEGLHEALLGRDRKASMIHHDEASDFFENLKTRDWMRTLKDQFAKWYSGRVDPMQKVRLKELRGKSALTSFNVHMMATPDRLTSLLDTEMFATGFLARFNWVWGSPPVNDDSRYRSDLVEMTDEGIHPAAVRVVLDVMDAVTLLGSKVHPMSVTREAQDRLEGLFRTMDTIAKGHDKYEIIEPAITRMGRETLWKCASLLALYRGETIIRLDDVLSAAYYAQDWFHTLFRVADAVSDGDFQRECNEIEGYIRLKGGSATRATIYHRFRSLIKKDPRELDARIMFLLESGRINRFEGEAGGITYKLNGGN